MQFCLNLAVSAVQPVAHSDIDTADAQITLGFSKVADRSKCNQGPMGSNAPSGYKSWQALSCTDRTDKNSLKTILGNNVAIRAIAEHKINL